MQIPFIDLPAQQERIREKLNSRIAQVLAHGRYILGPEVGELENQLAQFEGIGVAIGCANGTDAIILALKAMNIGPGDAVFCPSFTYAATAEAIAIIGATPIFVDVDRAFYTLCANSLELAIEQVAAQKTLTPRAIIAVDLFGQPANYPVLSETAQKYELKLISDCAQGFGCRFDGKSPLHWADAMTTSFFPAKPLGCYGDGGAVMVRDEELEARIRSLAFHGRSTVPNDHMSIGLNSRLDTLQAAILLEKLAIFEDEIAARGRAADYYNRHFDGHVLSTPGLIDGARSTWAQYCLEVPDRDSFMDAVKAEGVPLAAYYPLPTHAQTAYKFFPISPDHLPNTVAASKTIVALPMHGYLQPDVQDKIITACLKVLSKQGAGL